MASEIKPPKADRTYKRRNMLDPLIAGGAAIAVGAATANPAAGLITGGLVAAALGGREGIRQSKMRADEKAKKRQAPVRHPGRTTTIRSLSDARPK